MIKKIVLTLLFLFCISTIVEAQQELYWIDTTGGVNILRKVSNKYPLPVEVGNIDTVWYVRKLDSLIYAQKIDSLMYLRKIDSLIYIQKIDSLMYIQRMDSLIYIQRIDTLFELINGHVFTSDTTQLKYRNSFSLTTGDSIAQDTLYGNFNKLFIGGSDTGGTFTDSVVTELWDALLSVWKQVGVTNMWNGNFYSYVSPGAGETAEYVLDHEVVDIIRFRLINEEYVSGRTFEISWTGKGDK